MQLFRRFYCLKTKNDYRYPKLGSDTPKHTIYALRQVLQNDERNRIWHLRDFALFTVGTSCPQRVFRCRDNPQNSQKNHVIPTPKKKLPGLYVHCLSDLADSPALLFLLLIAHKRGLRRREHWVI